MRTVLFALLLVPSLVSANALPTRTLEPVVRISEDIIYVTDKKGNDWAVVTRCEINPKDVNQFTVKGKVLYSGKFVQLSNDLHCEIESIQAA
tara:strand:- start:189 stop:464 length:276 start_codon:yes stop_codon:yes gene_type:complete